MKESESNPKISRSILLCICNPRGNRCLTCSSHQTSTIRWRKDELFIRHHKHIKNATHLPLFVSSTYTVLVFMKLPCAEIDYFLDIFSTWWYFSKWKVLCDVMNYWLHTLDHFISSLQTFSLHMTWCRPAPKRNKNVKLNISGSGLKCVHLAFFYPNFV